MAITINLERGEAVFTVTAIETQIDKLVAFCRDHDAEFGKMNNLHKGMARDLLSARDKFVKTLRDNGYPMDYLNEYDTTSPEWTDIK